VLFDCLLGVRDGSTLIFVSIYKQTGSILKEKMFQGLKPLQVTSIEAEFSKTGDVDMSSYRPSRSSIATGPAPPLNMDLLVPRVDISDKITEALLAKMQDDNWKQRKEAMDDVITILAAANHRIQAKDGGLIEILKSRYIHQSTQLCFILFPPAVHLYWLAVLIIERQVFSTVLDSLFFSALFLSLTFPPRPVSPLCAC
jgi:hypothetical protein